MAGTIVRHNFTSEEIQDTIEAMVTAVDGQDIRKVMTACLVITLVSMYPGIKVDQLTEGVKGASEWISLYIASINGTDIPVV